MKYYFPTLAVSETLPPNIKVIDLGRVDNIYEYFRQILAVNNLPSDDQEVERFVDPTLKSNGGGLYFSTSGDYSLTYYYVCCARDRFHEIFIRGHEETHILDELKTLGKLETAIDKYFRVPIRLAALEKETIANVGGIWALKIFGMPKQDIKYVLDTFSCLNCPGNMAEARRLLGI